MATEFKILRGSSENLTTEKLRAIGKLVNGYWYLTNDTAEVYVCLENNLGELELKKINECNFDSDLDLESFDERLRALETEEKLHTFGYRQLFPTEGIDGHMYVAADEQKTYVWFNNDYLVVGTADGSCEEPKVIYGGSAE